MLSLSVCVCVVARKNNDHTRLHTNVAAAAYLSPSLWCLETPETLKRACTSRIRRVRLSTRPGVVVSCACLVLAGSCRLSTRATRRGVLFSSGFSSSSSSFHHRNNALWSKIQLETVDRHRALRALKGRRKRGEARGNFGFFLSPLRPRRVQN